MFFSLTHSSPSKFLQRTPNGVILNRFSNDISSLDNGITSNILTVINDFIKNAVLLYAIITGVKNYISLIPLVIFLVLSYRTRGRYIKVQREVQRLNFISKSPIIGTCSACITGGPVIRTSKSSDYLSNKLKNLVNENTKNLITKEALHWWFDIQQEIMQQLVMEIPLYLLTIWGAYNSDKIDKDVIVWLKFLSSFSRTIFRFFIAISGLEVNFIPIERLDKYENLESEKGYKNIESEKKLFREMNRRTHDMGKIYTEKKLKTRLNLRLLDQGRIRMNSIFARYPTGKENVINGIDLEILPGQSVGIVGRTGAGKSSFTKMLWRALDPFSGNIEIDGTDISSIDVKELRTQLNIVLQKPSVFEGTLLSNLSNGQKLTPPEIQKIRNELIHLGFPQEKLGDRHLNYEVKEGGSNLSQSEKQILSLVKAFRKESSVVILDEATAYVDPSLETVIQKRIKEAFKGKTVLTIAHKLSNIIDSDRILVMDRGRVAQFGSPKELIEQGEGIFYDLWKRR